MKKTISELTYKIVAFPEIQSFDTNESVDWAVEMMELGYDSPTLYILAGISKPTNYFEVLEYVINTVKELGLEMKRGDNATLSYASFYVHQIAKGKAIRENLTELYKFCTMRDYEEIVYDFYLLYWAWDSLDYEDNEYNHYWDGARKDTIEQIVLDVANKWIEENKVHYAQQCL